MAIENQGPDQARVESIRAGNGDPKFFRGGGMDP